MSESSTSGNGLVPNTLTRGPPGKLILPRGASLTDCVLLPGNNWKFSGILMRFHIASRIPMMTKQQQNMRTGMGMGVGASLSTIMCLHIFHRC